MGWTEALWLWCAVWGAVALVGYGRSLAGVTGAQRTVRLTGRIDRVREPRHGGSRRGGISVVVSYPDPGADPGSGRRVTVTNDGERGLPITVAWEGREIGVTHPRGRPHAYRFAVLPHGRGRGLVLPTFALLLVCAGLVALLALDRGWPWALVAGAGPCALYSAALLPGTVRARGRRLARLAAMEAVPGKVVAVLRDVSVDQDDGHTSTTVTPVVSFTTRGGTVVTAHCTEHLPDPAGARGLEVTVHHVPDDPADFTLDREADRRSQGSDAVFNAVVLVVFAATAAAGALLLR
ncbi:DUF3592 domain-containing protein [Kitasatospora sp. NPDC056327]|uniref:DUF3592 domain-containing protein n=1 Tax=Kitasatospora sp. NPDC056327 TaxID=3345785 RepID=UPI0035D636F7